MMKVIVSMLMTKNDDDQDAHSSIDGDAEDSDEKDSQNSNNINNNIVHNKNAIRLYSIAV